MPPKKKDSSKSNDVPTPMETDDPGEPNEANDPIQTSVSRGFNLEDYGEIEIPPAPQSVATYHTDGPRLMIAKIVNENFKSYAGIRSLGPFHKSFTSIVGPNGSGKSNVIDSMLFVFGYRAAKVRLKKLSDLIHHSENHLNVGACTVTVYFQKIIDTKTDEDDYKVVPDSEFTVSRTAHKDNSSYYCINGRRSQYREVAALLRGSGIDLDHNRFLILQGEVEQIAMMKAKAQTEHDDGMLEFLEDIIGSNRFKEPIEVLMKRVETLNELRGEKFNRAKAVEREKDELEDSKNEAVEFLTVENDIVKLKNKHYQKYISSCMNNESKAKEEYNKINSGMEEFNKKMNDITEERQQKVKKQKKIYKAYDDLTKQCEENKEKFSEMEKTDVKMREDLKHVKAKGKKLEKNVEQEKKKIENLKEEQEQAGKNTGDLQKKQEKLEKEKGKEEENFQKVMESLKTETQELQKEKDKKEEKLLGMQTTVNEKRSQLEVTRSELDIYLSNQKQETNKLNEMTKRMAKAEESLKDREGVMSDLQKKFPNMEAGLEKAQKDLDDACKREQELKEEVGVLRRKVEEARSSMEAQKSHGKTVDFLMNLKKSGTLPGILGRLGDLGAIDAKYDVAISTACGSLDHILVDTMDTAQKCVEQLKRNNVGIATFIGLDKMQRWRGHASQTIKTPENVKRLFDLVQVKDEHVKPAFYLALRDTLVADNLDQATRIAYGAQRFRVVTLEGHLIDQSGTMSGGGRSVCRGRMGSKLVSDVDTKDFANNEARLKKIQQESQQCRTNKERLEDFVKQQNKDIQHVQHSIQKSEMEIRQFRDQIEQIKVQIKEQEEIVKAAAPEENQLKELEKKVGEYKKEYEKVYNVSSKLEQEIQELHEQIMDIGGSKMMAAQARVNTIQQQIDQVTGQITKASVAVKTSERNLKKAEDKLKNLYEEIEENKEDVIKMEKNVTDLEQEAIKVMDAYRESQETMKAAEVALTEVNKDLARLEEEENKIQKDSIDIKTELDKFNNIIKENQQKIKHWKKELSHLQLTPIDGQEVGELPTLTAEELESISKEDIQFQITVQEEKLSKMNPNMAAIAEYRKKEELYLQRAAELDQITSFRDKQRHYFEDLRKQRLNEFMAGFSVIALKLKEMYQMITLGGNAELELVDSLDPFSEGIVFSVRPPKKSWKNISNLSGGEKTLSSLALVFALHHYKPSPLYVMDEIDAALDFKNVSIVANYIKERTKNAQFIIISLRNNMFELADCLVGIYKTDNCTKSVTINPSKLSIPLGEVSSNAGQAPPTQSTTGAPTASLFTATQSTATQPQVKHEKS